jgi:hypothetical protein
MVLRKFMSLMRNKEDNPKDRYYSLQEAEGDNGPCQDIPCHRTVGLVVAIVQRCSRWAGVCLPCDRRVGDYRLRHHTSVGTNNDTRRWLR